MLDANVLTEPRVWQISKINRSVSKGIAVFTCTQELANQHTLKADYDEYGNVTAWWADWNENQISPNPAIQDNTSNVLVYGKITVSGLPKIKVGGTGKTFTLSYYQNDGEPYSDYPAGVWSLWIDGERVPNSLVEFTDVDVNPYKLKVKFLGDDSYIGKILTVVNNSGDIRASLDVEIVAL